MQATKVQSVPLLQRLSYTKAVQYDTIPYHEAQPDTRLSSNSQLNHKQQKQYLKNVLSMTTKKRKSSIWDALKAVRINLHVKHTSLR